MLDVVVATGEAVVAGILCCFFRTDRLLLTAGAGDLLAVAATGAVRLDLALPELRYCKSMRRHDGGNNNLAYLDSCNMTG